MTTDASNAFARRFNALNIGGTMTIQEYSARIRERFCIGEHEWNGMEDADKIHWAEQFDVIGGVQ